MVFMMNEFLSDNENILFIIPKSLFNLPSQIFFYCNMFTNFHEIKEFSNDMIFSSKKEQILNENTNSIIIENKKEKEEIFKSKENFSFLILKFYFTVLASEKIKNPELREKFNLIISKFIIAQNPTILNSILLIDLFVRGILIDIDKFYLSQHAIRNILKLVDRFSLTDTKSSTDKSNNGLENLKKFSETHINTFENLCGKIFTNLNKYMSEFMQEITNTYNSINNNNTNILTNQVSKSHAIRKFINYTIYFSEDLVLLEILIKLNSKVFLDPNKLLFENLLNFFTNLSTRLINESSYKKIRDILTFYVNSNTMSQSIIQKQNVMNDIFKGLSYPIISIINDLNNENAFTENNEFIKQLAYSDFIDFQNFKNILTDLKLDSNESSISNLNIPSIPNTKNSKNINKDINKKEIEEILQKYMITIDSLIEKKKAKIRSKVREDELRDKNENESLCFICFSRNMDIILSPCNHSIQN